MNHYYRICLKRGHGPCNYSVEAEGLVSLGKTEAMAHILDVYMSRTGFQACHKVWIEDHETYKPYELGTYMARALDDRRKYVNYEKEDK